MTTVIGFAGKMGSGKSYYSNKLKEVLEAQGKKVEITSFAKALKDDVTNLIRDYHNQVAIQMEYNIPIAKIGYLYGLLSTTDENMTGYDKTNVVRNLLQFYGTDVRRQQERDYWVDRLYAGINNELDYIIVEDVRFENEANRIILEKGKVFYLDVPESLRHSRLLKRDGYTPTEKQENHQSEKLSIEVVPNMIVVKEEEVENHFNHI